MNKNKLDYQYYHSFIHPYGAAHYTTRIHCINIEKYFLGSLRSAHTPSSLTQSNPFCTYKQRAQHILNGYSQAARPKKTFTSLWTLKKTNTMKTTTHAFQCHHISPSNCCCFILLLMVYINTYRVYMRAYLCIFFASSHVMFR